jgi:putative polyhydroxyalkanoate system protein
MSEINLEREHDLGLDKARALAQQWVADGASKLGLVCQHEAGADQDTVTFSRTGVSGSMKVSGTRFELQVKLGMLMSAMKPLIEAEITKNLAAAIAKSGGSSSPTA